jgi:hypothetical protein
MNNKFVNIWKGIAVTFFYVPSRDCAAGTDRNHNNFPGQDLSPDSAEYETGALKVRFLFVKTDHVCLVWFGYICNIRVIKL